MDIVEQQCPRSRPTSPLARRGGISQGPGRGAPSSSPESPPGRSRRHDEAHLLDYMAEFQILPPVQSYIDHFTFGYDYDDQDGFSNDDDKKDNPSLAPLGLINRQYDFKSRTVTEQWSGFGSETGESWVSHFWDIVVRNRGLVEWLMLGIRRGSEMDIMKMRMIGRTEQADDEVWM